MKKRRPTWAILAKTSANTNVWHLQSFVSYLLSYVSEHASTHFCLTGTSVRSLGRSPQPSFYSSSMTHFGQQWDLYWYCLCSLDGSNTRPHGIDPSLTFGNTTILKYKFIENHSLNSILEAWPFWHQNCPSPRSGQFRGQKGLGPLEKPRRNAPLYALPAKK